LEVFDMLLAIDMGNTQTVVGLLDGEGIAHHWRFATSRSRTADEYRLLIHGLFDLDEIDVDDISGVIISSVVPHATEALHSAAAMFDAVDVLVVGPGVKTGMPILIDNPKEVGADRIVNAVAARQTYGAPVVVVDFGTSTNFDVVSREGEYLGGAIAPGLEVSMDALVSATAALRRVALEPPRAAVGKGTVEAIQSGLLYGHAGLVDGIMGRIVAELGLDTATVATGGLAPLIVPLCETVDHIDEHLTLAGLRLLWDRNRG
jgi:type III pantothenate kinase